MTSIESEKVAGLLRALGEEVVLPRYRELSAADIEEKAPGDFVTRVDREVEHRLTAELTGLRPGSRCIGEEACHLDPDLLASLGHGWVWLIDPIDGTRNLVSGAPDFAVMVALLHDGETIASWMHSPVSGWLAASELGAGSTLDDTPISISPEATAPGVIYSRFLPDAIGPCVLQLRDENPYAGPGCGSAGCDYVSLVRGDIGFTVFWRTLSWDHAAGVLFASEAGALVGRINGDPYLPVEEHRRGLIAAPPSTFGRLARLLKPCHAL